MPTGTYTAPPDKNQNDAYTEQNWDTHVMNNILFFKSYLDELKDGLAYAAITADVNVPAGTLEGAPVDIITLPSFTVATGYTKFIVETATPGSSGVILNLWDGATDIGRIVSNSAGSGAQEATFFATPVVLATGAHVLKIRAWNPSGGALVFQAGASGAGVQRPAYAIVRHGPTAIS